MSRDRLAGLQDSSRFAMLHASDSNRSQLMSDHAALTPQQLADALDQADYRVLLMVVFHLTGDRRWLEPPYRPERDVRLIADEDAGLSADARAEIRTAAADLLADPHRQAAITDPGDALMVEMMSACLGERVPPEYAPMMREEIGLTPRQVTWSGQHPPPAKDDFPVIIVGAGASGIALGANLMQLAIPFVIVEQNDDVGGTWLVNRYPGCGVDTPNHAYSFSFGKRYRWSRYFAPRDELIDYLRRSADDLDIRKHIRFATRAVRSDWDEATASWRVEIEHAGRRETLTGRALISAVGQLSLPSIPKIAGADDFAGPLFHTAHWPADLDLTGKRVAIIGTGASAMQIVPSIVDDVQSLAVFQRSAQWARPIPRYHDPIPDGAQWLLANVPLYAAWYRFTMLWRYGDGLLPTLHKDPEWPHPERSLNRANDRHRQEMADHMAAELAGRDDLLAKCLPTYPPYGKRILLDNGWFQAIRRPNAELVTEDIARITRDGIETADGKTREFDVIVLSTGFKVGQLTARLNATGRGGRKLHEVWAGDNPAAHLGITIPGFPNLFSTQGPNTGLGHGGSAIFQSECQARYIVGCIRDMIEQGIRTMEPRQEVHDDYVRRVDDEHAKLIWTHPGMSTYYRNSRGRVVSVMPWRLVDYWAMTHTPDLDDYHIEHAAAV